MVEVLRTSDPVHAEAFRLALLEEGIEAGITGATLPDFLQGTIRVWVGHEAEVPRAREILASLEAEG